jgi:hypothetical protein
MTQERGDPAEGHLGRVAGSAKETKASQHYPDQSFPVKSSAPRKHTGAPQMLYSGRERLGTVQQIAAGWRAFNRRNQSLGVFPTRSEAIDAIGKSLRGTA